jgi:serine/threonine protein kinase/Tol biopolymer transport system component
MPLDTGTRLGPYEVTGLIGSGGMGEVYRAHDTRLGRNVAVKVLPASMAGDPDRQARFEREARTVAGLSHPHICAIYDVGRHRSGDGEAIEFLVMELLEGETLAARLARGGARSSSSPGSATATPTPRKIPSAAPMASSKARASGKHGRPLPLDETLRIGSQLADALAAAHRAGIVHRDLKPANVMITKSGVKVLDFGLAKLQEPAAAVDHATATAPLTGAGVVMGTMPYMAPEQVQGHDVDARADLFALGAILHEMVTGERAFAADSQAGLIAALLDQQPPPISAIVPSAPRALERVIQRCLEKDRNDRWQSAQDLAAELKWIDQTLRQPDSPSSMTTVTATRPRWKWLAATGVVAALVLLAIGAGAMIARRGTPLATAAAPIHAHVRLPDGVSLAGWGSPVMALSPDGRLLAVVGMKAGVPKLFVQRLDRDETIEVPNSDEAEGPFFSPDGQWIAFAVGVSARSGMKGELKKYSLATRLTQSITDIGDYFGGAWRADGTIFFMGRNAAPLQKVRAEGGKSEAATPPIRPTARKIGNYGAMPQLLPGGRNLLLVAEADDGDPRPAILDLETGEIATLEVVSSFNRYVSSGHLVYMRLDGTLMAVPFDAEAGRIIGSEVAVISGISVVGGWEPAFAVSDNGVLAYSTGPVNGSSWTSSRLVRIDNGVVTALPFEPDYLRGIRASTDGSLLAGYTADGTLWIYDLRRTSRTKLPEDDVRYRDAPAWSPDNTRIAFMSAMLGWHLYVQRIDGVSTPELILRGPEEKSSGAFTPDGQSYVFTQQKAQTTGTSLWRIRLAASQRPERLTSSAATEINPAFSPDGKWLAYSTTDSGRYEVYLQPYPALNRRVQVSTTGSSSPRWSAGSRTLYYGSGTRLYAVSISGTSANVTVGHPREVFNIPGIRGAQPMPDGSFVALQNRTDVGTVTDLRLVVNWFDELRRIAPAR